MDKQKYNILPIEDDKVFYQKVNITTNSDSNEYSVRLDDNFNYCVGVMLENPIRVGGNRIFAIKKQGSYVLDKIPFALLHTKGLFDFKEKFLKVNFEAKGSEVKFFIDNAGDGNNTYSFILLLVNKKSSFKVPSYDFNLIEIPPLSSFGGAFLFKDNNIIKDIAFFTYNQADKLSINVFDNSRVYMDNLISVYLHDNLLNGVNDRFIKCWMPPNSLKYKFYNDGSSTQYVFVVFKYEEEDK